MAIFSYSASVVQRKKGQSAVASSAYATGVSMTDERTGERHTYKRPEGAIVNLPSVCPGRRLDTADLWNQAEAAEKRMNSRTARKIIVALPVELDREQHQQVLKEHVSFLVKRYGCAVSTSIHYDHDNNPHAHLQMTTRRFIDGQPGEKIRELDGSHKQRKIEMETMRSAWAESLNKRLKAGGHQLVDHRSYKRQGLDKLPQKHLGPVTTALERKGVETEKGDFNMDVNRINRASAFIFEHGPEGKKAKEEKAFEAKLKRELERIRAHAKTVHGGNGISSRSSSSSSHSSSPSYGPKM